MIAPAFGGFLANGQSPATPLSQTPQPPSFSDPHVTSTVINQNSQFTLKWTDPSLIKGCIFSYDSGTGTFVNSSYVPENSTTVIANTTETIYGNPGEKIRWMYYAQDESGLWTKSYTYSFVAGYAPGAVSLANFRLITDNSYDLLAYDGTNLANLGSFPQFVGTYGSAVGFHEVSWNPQGTFAIAVGYNNSAILYTKSGGLVKVLSTPTSQDTNLVGLAWTPNGTSAVITGSNPDVILVYSTLTGNFTQFSNLMGVGGLGQVAWNPISNYAIIAGSDGLLKLSDGGSLGVIPSAAGISFTGIDFNPNGTVALLTASNGGVYKYSSTTSNLSLVTTISGNPQLQYVKFSRDGAYALISAKSGSASDLYKFDGQSIYPITSSSSTQTANQISFSPDDSYAVIATTGGLLTENYDANTATFSSISANSTLKGLDFLPPPIITTTTTTTTNTSSTSTLASISIQANSGPYYVGKSIELSGNSLDSNESAVPSQTIYIWVNGQNQGSTTSNSTGYWTFSFTPTSNETYYAAASQNADGSGVTSQQLVLYVVLASVSITTSSTTTSTTTNTTGTQTSTTSTMSTTTNASSTSATTQSVTSTSSTVTNSSSKSIATSSSATTSTSTISNSTSSSTQQSTTSSNTGNLIGLFTTIPYVTTNSPSPLGTAIFVCEVGIVIIVLIIVRDSKNRDQGGGPSRNWRW